MLCLCQRWFARTRGVHFSEMERRIFTASRRTTRIRDACKAVQKTEPMCRRFCHHPRLPKCFRPNECIGNLINMHQRGPPSHPIIHRTKHTVATFSNPPGTGLLSGKMVVGLKSQLEHCGRKSAQEGLAGCRGQVVSSVRIRRRRGCDMIKRA